MALVSALTHDPKGLTLKPSLMQWVTARRDGHTNQPAMVGDKADRTLDLATQLTTYILAILIRNSKIDVQLASWEGLQAKAGVTGITSVTRAMSKAEANKSL